jgi:CHASE3 domain sensor protein
MNTQINNYGTNTSNNTIRNSVFVTEAKKYLRTTPGKIIIASISIIIVAIFMSTIIFVDYKSTRQAVQTVGKDTVPSIIAAEHIRATLADANSNAMNALMIKEKDNGIYWTTYRKEMDEAHSELIDASENITYGNEERDPIQKIMSKISEYEFVLGKARLTTSNNVADDFAEANKIMSEEILPAASDLDKANYSHLDSIYSGHKAKSGALTFSLICVVVIAMVAILWVQRFLYKKTKRILNIGFTAALVLTFIFGCYSFGLIQVVEKNLKVAKEDAFDSIHNLWKARAITYDGNADESMYLLYSGNNQQQEVSLKAFTDKESQITSVEPDQALALLNQNKSFKGFLGDELSNVTFDGEKDAATETLKYWDEYIKMDSKFRSLENDGHHDEAVKLCTGTSEGESDWLFNKFDSALGKTLDINQKQFDSNINSALSALNVFPFILGAYLILFIAAIFFGVKPRLDEYKF